MIYNKNRRLTVIAKISLISRNVILELSVCEFTTISKRSTADTCAETDGFRSFVQFPDKKFIAIPYAS